MKHQHIVMAVALTCAMLTACGGSDGPPPVMPPPAPGPTEAVPPEASQSSAGLIAYLLALAANLVEDKEPVDLSTFHPVKPEDTEPEPVG